jgi:hypothetical protein
MGRPKKDPADRVTQVSIGLTARELHIVQHTMEQLGVDRSSAVRALIRAGARGPASTPFTPAEGTDE